MPTTVPHPTWGPQGFQPQPESAILAGTTADIAAAFPGINPSPATPQGQLATSEAATIGAQQDLFLQVQNLMDPALTYGRYQDAIGRIWYQTRTASVPTSFIGVCIGANGVTIPSGATCTDQSGINYVSTAAGTFDSTGTLNIPFAAVIDGPTPVPTEIVQFQLIPGWDAISVTEGVVGSLEQNSQQFEAVRARSTANRAFGGNAAIEGALLAANIGVTDAYVIDNATGTTQTLPGGIVLPWPCQYIAVLGGDPQAVANVIFSRKGPGCP